MKLKLSADWRLIATGALLFGTALLGQDTISVRSVLVALVAALGALVQKQEPPAADPEA